MLHAKTRFGSPAVLVAATGKAAHLELTERITFPVAHSRALAQAKALRYDDEPGISCVISQV